VAIGISGYLEAFLDGFGVSLPVSVTASAEEGGVVNIPAILICLLVTFILGRGTKAFGRFELVAVAIKIVLILFIIGLGISTSTPRTTTRSCPRGSARCSPARPPSSSRSSATTP
jgi:amino acid transporter